MDISPINKTTFLIAELDRLEPEVQKIISDNAGIAIAGVEDKTGYKAAKAAFTEIRNQRLKIQALDKDFAALVSSARKSFGARADKHVRALAAVEDEIRTEINRIDQEKKDAAAAAESERAAKYNAITERLFTEGEFTFDGFKYFVGTVYVMPDQILSLTEAELETLINQGAAEAERIRELMAAAEAERAALAKPINGPINESAAEHTPPRGYTGAGGDFGGPVVERRYFSGQREFGTPPDQPEPIRQAIPDGFRAGFQAAKAEILAFANRPEKFTRAELQDFIISLEPAK